MAPRILPIEEGLAARFEQKAPDDCWPWKGYKNTYGYGQFFHGGRYRPAHRAMFEFKNGPIPQGLFVLHRCDNPICVNPAHLFLGTQLDNMTDCIAKDRNNRGERNGQHKLTEEMVLEIRRLYDLGQEGYMKLGQRLGIPSSTIRNVIKRKRWKHL
jgi:hypothetical protein